eukprot:m51a1_g7533 hypothetical protein (413) ;mRNA; f:47585-49052
MKSKFSYFERASPASGLAPSAYQTISSRHQDEHLKTCCKSISEKLRDLKDCGFLSHSVNLKDMTTSGSRFQILEFYGDAYLCERISFFLLQTRRFLDPHLLTQLRMKVEYNLNLSRCYSLLGLGTLLGLPTPDSPPAQALVLRSTIEDVRHRSEDRAKHNGGAASDDDVAFTARADAAISKAQHKARADVIEAMIGELAERVNLAGDSRSGKIVEARELLDDLITFISFIGEQDYFTTGQVSAYPTPSPSHPANPGSSQPSSGGEEEAPAPAFQYRAVQPDHKKPSLVVPTPTRPEKSAAPQASPASSGPRPGFVVQSPPAPSTSPHRTSRRQQVAQSSPAVPKAKKQQQQPNCTVVQPVQILKRQQPAAEPAGGFGPQAQQRKAHAPQPAPPQPALSFFDADMPMFSLSGL